MRTTKLLALTLAGVMAASLLTGCPQQQGGPDAAQSTPPGQDCSTNCTLEKDIVLTDEWTPISFYVGTFDGQGHTISGLQVTQSDFATNGMFRMIKKGGCVKNLRLENPMVTGTKSNTSNGAIVGQPGRGGQIIGCTVSDRRFLGAWQAA